MWIKPTLLSCHRAAVPPWRSQGCEARWWGSTRTGTRSWQCSGPWDNSTRWRLEAPTLGSSEPPGTCWSPRQPWNYLWDLNDWDEDGETKCLLEPISQKECHPQSSQEMYPSNCTGANLEAFPDNPQTLPWNCSNAKISLFPEEFWLDRFFNI